MSTNRFIIDHDKIDHGIPGRPAMVNQYFVKDTVTSNKLDVFSPPSFDTIILMNFLAECIKATTPQCGCGPLE